MAPAQGYVALQSGICAGDLDVPIAGTLSHSPKIVCAAPFCYLCRGADIVRILAAIFCAFDVRHPIRLIGRDFGI